MIGSTVDRSGKTAPAPRLWRFNFQGQPVGISEAAGEPLILLADVARHAVVDLPPDVLPVAVPVRIIIDCIFRAPTRAGAAFARWLADRIVLATPRDPSEIASGLLAFRLEEEAHPDSGLRLVQHLGFGVIGAALIEGDLRSASRPPATIH